MRKLKERNRIIKNILLLAAIIISLYLTAKFGDVFTLPFMEGAK